MPHKPFPLQRIHVPEIDFAVKNLSRGGSLEPHHNPHERTFPATASTHNNEDIAAVVHDTNKSFCGRIGESQPPWRTAPRWQKESAIAGVKSCLGNPEWSPEEGHKNWLEHKLAEGWSYGPVKDPDKKQHPCMVSYDQLPAEQQAKDALFLSIVRSLAPLLL